MPPDPSHDVSTLEQAALEQFTTDLIDAGFRPRDGDRHHWVGPIDASFSSLTTAREMRIEIRDGWPHRHPYLFVDGLSGRRHVNAHGNVCLWDEADDGYGWLRLDEVRERVKAWCADQAGVPAGPALDTHLYYERSDGTQLVVLDLDELEDRGRVSRQDGGHGRLRAELTKNLYSVGTKGAIEVAWYRRTRLDAPPANWASFRGALTQAQQADLSEFTRRLSRSRSSLALLIWHDEPVTAVLALRLKKGASEGAALEVALTSRSVMGLRAGSDATILRGKVVTIFGAGAIGSQVALLLARSGVGRLILVDRELLRPGNLVRHAASATYVGLPKVEAVKRTIVDALPHVDISTVEDMVWDVPRARQLARAGDLVVDSTGNRAYARMLSRIASSVDAPRPMVMTALYRRGAIARVSIQAGTSVEIADRAETNGFPVVPADPNELSVPRWEPGCGAPVNDAPPWAVAAAAALGAKASVDVLMNRLFEDIDLVDVYDPIPSPPFNSPGLHIFRPEPKAT